MNKKNTIPDKYCFLADVLDELSKERNLIVSEHMSDDDIENVKKIMSHFRNVKVYSIRDEQKKRRLVFKNNFKCKYISITSRLERGKDAYESKDYLKCAEIYESIIPYFDEPRSFIYAKIGMSYFKLGREYYSKAIDYLIVAQAKSKHERESNYHFNEIIKSMKRYTKYNGAKVLTKK